MIQHRQKSPLEKVIILQDLQRKLAFMDYDYLGLRFLNPLRSEVETELGFLLTHSQPQKGVKDA